MLHEDPPPRKVVVIGGGLAGLRAAEGISKRDKNFSVTLIGDEPHRPYARPPLTKAGSSGLELTSLSLAGKSGGQFDVQTGVRIRELDPARGFAASEDGRVFRFDTAVVATGLVPRRSLTVDSNTGAALRNSTALRTYNDHLAVQRVLRTGKHVAVLGAGFVGCELASSLTEAGRKVTLFGRAAAPLAKRLGYRISTQISSLIAGAGVEYINGTSPTAAHNEGDSLVLEFPDGLSTRTDLLIEALGSYPDLSFWRGAPPEPGHGLSVGVDMKVTGTDNTYAVGDVAEFETKGISRPQRHEHWATAVDTARIAADAITSQPRTPPVIIPSCWSDLFGHRLQTLGIRTADSEEIDLSNAAQSASLPGGETLTGFVSQGRLTGIAGMSPAGRPSPVIAWRREIASTFQQLAAVTG